MKRNQEVLSQTPKCVQIGIFGLKINHQATLVLKYVKVGLIFVKIFPNGTISQNLACWLPEMLFCS
jgi:hypothetical protein